MMSLAVKLLGPPEEVATCGFLPNQFQRWMIFENQHIKVYLHHSASDVFSDGLASYPKTLISIGFANSCGEQLADPLRVNRDRAAWMVLIAKSVHGPENNLRA
jgi:hypothetical protein